MAGRQVGKGTACLKCNSYVLGIGRRKPVKWFVLFCRYRQCHAVGQVVLVCQGLLGSCGVRKGTKPGMSHVTVVTKVGRNVAWQENV